MTAEETDKVWVELHPLSAIMPANVQRWRVMYEGEQQSMHPSIEEADSAADELRKRIRAGWTEARGEARQTGQAHEDWNR